MTPKQFNKRMKQVGELVRANAEAGLRATALVVDQTVVVATPVDTGRARANWIVTADRPSYRTTDSTDFNAALQDARGVIASATDQIYISNNLDYIGPLNDGSSAQAPAGFVQKAVQLGLIEAAKIRVLKGA